MSPQLGQSHLFAIIFAPFTGGNHLANLISLNDTFLPRFWSKNYLDDLKLIYKDSKLGVHPIRRSNFFDLPFLESTTLTKKYICHGHLGHYYHMISTLNINFDNISGIVIKKATSNERALARYKFTNQAKQDKLYPYPQNYTLPLNIADKELLNKNNGLEIDSDLFFSDEGSYYVQESLLNCFNITLPDVIHSLHKDWIKMIDNSLDIKANT